MRGGTRVTLRRVIAGIFVAAIACLALTATVGLGSSTGSSPQAHGSKTRMTIQRRTTFEVVRPDDIPALRRWTIQRCRGNSVAHLAKALRVENNLDAVVDRLAEGLPPE